MEIVLYILLALVGLWLLAKIVMGIAAPSLKKRDRNSAGGKAILQVVEATGRFDGSRESRQRAYETFMDLAEEGPYEISNRWHTIEEMAVDFSNSLTSSSGPILVEAAYTAVGAHRLHYPDASRSTTSKERHADLSAASLLISLFPDWVNEHQVSTPDVFVEQKRRFALVVWLMLDKCEREGLLLERGAGVDR